jgi:protein TonB
VPTGAQSGELAPESSSPPQVAQGGGSVKTPSVYLPAPDPGERPAPKKADPSNTPAAIPDKVEPPAPERPAASKPQSVLTAQDEQKAIETEGSGLFGVPKGFPLGDYADIVIRKIKGNWYIPSNLRNSQGRTTVIFYIGKDGRYTGAHIVSSSGSTSLDLAALNAVLGSNPFPPLPQGFPGERVGAKFVFSYNERQ